MVKKCTLSKEKAFDCCSSLRFPRKSTFCTILDKGLRSKPIKRVYLPRKIVWRPFGAGNHAKMECPECTFPNMKAFCGLLPCFLFLLFFFSGEINIFQRFPKIPLYNPTLFHPSYHPFLVLAMVPGHVAQTSLELNGVLNSFKKQFFCFARLVSGVLTFCFLVPSPSFNSYRRVLHA